MIIEKHGKVTVEIKDDQPHAEIINFEVDYNGSSMNVLDFQSAAIRWAIESLEKIESDITMKGKG